MNEFNHDYIKYLKTQIKILKEEADKSKTKLLTTLVVMFTLWIMLSLVIFN